MPYTCKCQCESFAEHAGSVSLSMIGMPTRSVRATQIVNTDKQWDKDGEAYTRMRRQGLQPWGIDGCAKLEAKANHPIEIEYGKLYGDKAKYAAEVHEEVKAATTP